MRYDVMVVGAGFFGATAAHLLARAGQRVLLIDRREHLAGNAHSPVVEGARRHEYGAHIFHTDNEQIWRFVNRFADFNGYRHKVYTKTSYGIFSLPLNMLTFQKLWGAETPQDAERMLAMTRESFADPQNMEEYCLQTFGRQIYELFIRDYTCKQWGRAPHTLPVSIARRIPLRMTYNNDYFADRYQGIPKGGYTELIACMLDEENITVRLGESWNAQWQQYAKRLIYSGPLDQLFDCKYGPLPYRSLRFHHRKVSQNQQGAAVLNHPEFGQDFTRTIEHCHFHPEETLRQGWYTWETPAACNEENPEPYYPVPGRETSHRRMQYIKLAHKQQREILVGGRLGQYRYMDMHQVIAEAWAKVGSWA